MSKHRFIPVPSRRAWIALVLALLLASVAFQAVFAAERSFQPEQQAGLQLPRLILTLDESGTVSELSVMVSDDTRLRFATTQLTFLSTVLGIPLDQQLFDAATMQALADAELQHVGLETGRAGIALYGNGEPMLGIEWGDDAALTELARLGEGINVPLAQTLTQVVPNIGVDLLIELPVPAGTEAVAPHPFSAGVEFPEPADQPSIVPIVLHLRGEYTVDGTAYLYGEPLADWGRLINLDLSVLNLNPQAIDVFQAAGLQTMGVQIDNTGTSLWANGNRLVRVIPGSEETLGLAAGLAEQFQVPFTELIPVAARTTQVDVDITVDLPAAQ